MKPVKLKHEDPDTYMKLNQAINEAEGYSRARTITAYQIVTILDDVLTTLSISKKSMEGVHVTVDINAQKFPTTYNYRPESTYFHAVYKSGSWRIDRIWRDTCRGSKTVIIHHTEASKEALIERFSSL